MSLAVQSISYIDNREYPSNRTIHPGPLGYQMGALDGSPMNVVPTVMFFLNLWLADGLLVNSVGVPVIRVSDPSRFSFIVVMLSML